METIMLKGNWNTREVWLDGKKLNPEWSQRIRNHSPGWIQLGLWWLRTRSVSSCNMS